MLECISCRYGRAFALLLLFTLTKCDSIFKEMEGEGASFEFFYPCNASDITLQYGNRIPFYRPSEPLTLTADQTGRFKVQTSSSSCSLHLQIDPVMRSDAGTYILLANDYDYIERVGLRVDFSPGKPQCKSRGKHVTVDWVELHCTASVGSMVGKIQCYQDGTPMPPLDEPSETMWTLEQTILVRKNQYNVFCCSTPAIEPKQKCECNDFVWDPISESEAIAKDPCPTTTHVPISTTSPADQTSKHGQSIHVTTASPRISDEMIFNDPKRKSVTWYIPRIAVMAILTIIMLIWNIVKFIRFRKENALYDNSSRPTFESSSCATSEKETKVEMTPFLERNKKMIVSDR